jgi:hypothetical protein
VTDSPKLAVLALNEVAKLLGKLTEEQLTDLAEGKAFVEFRSGDEAITSRVPKKAPASKQKIDLDEVIRDIKAMTEEDAVERYLLERDKLISVAQMRELATMIGSPVSAKGTKPQLRKNIAAGTAGVLNRPASAFSDAWVR